LLHLLPSSLSAGALIGQRDIVAGGGPTDDKDLDFGAGHEVGLGVTVAEIRRWDQPLGLSSDVHDRAFREDADDATATQVSTSNFRQLPVIIGRLLMAELLGGDCLRF
jgi:hypothetical protein